MGGSTPRGWVGFVRRCLASAVVLVGSGGCGVSSATLPSDRPPPRSSEITVEAVPGPLDLEPPPLEVVLEGPVRTPYQVAPRLLNRADLLGALVAAYPADLRDAEVEGTPRIWLLVDPQGRVLSRRLHESSGQAELDVAALVAAQVPRFAPALLRGRPVYVWISVPFPFKLERSSREGWEAELGEAAATV